MGYSKEQFTHERERQQYLSDRAYYGEFYGTFSTPKTQHIKKTFSGLERLRIADIENELKLKEL